MQLLFKTRDRQAEGLRTLALSRAGAVLRRMAWRVSHAQVQLTDVDGPRHGIDKQCRVSVVATDGTPVVVTAVARDWPTALNQALGRALQVLKRQFRRALQARRQARQFIRGERQGLRADAPEAALNFGKT